MNLNKSQEPVEWPAAIELACLDVGMVVLAAGRAPRIEKPYGDLNYIHLLGLIIWPRLFLNVVIVVVVVAVVVAMAVAVGLSRQFVSWLGPKT